MVRRPLALPCLLLALSIALGIVVIIWPEFGDHIPSYAAPEFVAQVGGVAAAMDTWRVTHGLPISSSAIRPGVEYPYILFGNTAFYVIAAAVGLALGIPAYLGAGTTLALGFALAAVCIFVVATRAGVNPYLSAALGFLYASGPYFSVDLFVRNSFPEYLNWQIVPGLLLLVSRALRPGAGPVALLSGAVALAAPFYFHKLLAPHVALTLGLLGLNAAPWRPSAAARLALLGCLGLLFSVPAWYPSVRSFNETVAQFAEEVAPAIFHRNLADVFWPVAANSLPSGPDFDFYEGRFALQAGLVPLAGVGLAGIALVTQPHLAWGRRLLLPMALFIVNVALILGWFGIWRLAPSQLKYIQFAYRLLGLVHLLGFVLFIQVIGSPSHLLRRMPAEAQRAAAGLFVVLAAAGVSTYWHRPPPTDAASAGIKPADLGAVDPCSLCRPTPRSSLVTVAAISRDGDLEVPPIPIATPTEGSYPSIIMEATVLPLAFQMNSDALTIRLYGFTKVRQEATLGQITGVLHGIAAAQGVTAPMGTLARSMVAVPARMDAGAAAEPRLPGTDWTARPLASITVAAPGPIRLQAPLDASIAAVAIECSRGVSPKDLDPSSGDARKRCLRLDALAPPNHGDTFVRPREVPRAKVTRRPLGTVLVDARKLAAGDYLLPALAYSIVRVTNSAGAAISTYEFDRRPVIRHSGKPTTYTVSYDFGPERQALVTGGVLYVIAATAMWLGGRVYRRPS